MNVRIGVAGVNFRVASRANVSFPELDYKKIVNKIILLFFDSFSSYRLYVQPIPTYKFIRDLHSRPTAQNMHTAVTPKHFDLRLLVDNNNNSTLAPTQNKQ